ncbi:MAG: diguanylate cyclase [Candidatus Aminicenantes bacterium]|nr:diguanylate cyclase [Candidatus Aminicenantes bacterium]
MKNTFVETASRQKSRFSVLVAEDDPLTKRLLEKKLKDWGYTVLKAEDGNKALKTIKQPEVRMAILDWMMPGLEGPEICSKLRQSKKPKYTYIILLTARDTSFDIIQGLEAGADDYMTKPINFMELRARLKTAHRILELEDNLIKAQKKLLKLATMDSLTGAWNRRTILSFIREELERFKREKNPFGLLMIDLDNFKNINDSYGHQAGDAVLKNIVKMLKKNLRPFDRIGRYGGDELLILLPNCNIFNTGIIATRLLEHIRKNKINFRHRATLSATLSIGGTSTDSISQPNLVKLIRTADRALYLAKKLGRDRVTLFGDSIKMEAKEKKNARKEKR